MNTALRLLVASVLAASVLVTSVPALASDDAAPAAAAAAPAPAATDAPAAKAGVGQRVKDWLMAKDGRGDTRVKRLAIQWGGLGVMLGGLALITVVGVTVSVAPTCAAVGMERCQQNFTNMVRDVPAALTPANQHVPVRTR